MSFIMSCCCLYISSESEWISFTFFSCSDILRFSMRSPIDVRMESKSGPVSPRPLLALATPSPTATLDAALP